MQTVTSLSGGRRFDSARSTCIHSYMCTCTHACIRSVEFKKIHSNPRAQTFLYASHKIGVLPMMEGAGVEALRFSQGFVRFDFPQTLIFLFASKGARLKGMDPSCRTVLCWGCRVSHPLFCIAISFGIPLRIQSTVILSLSVCDAKEPTRVEVSHGACESKHACVHTRTSTPTERERYVFIYIYVDVYVHIQTLAHAHTCIDKFISACL